MKSKQSELFEERFINFSVDIIRLVEAHKIIPVSVSSQVIRSSSSIGANYAEAQNAASRADFKNKIFIAKKEAAETRYWLRIIEKLTSPEIVFQYLKESQEILLILQKIINTINGKSAT
jgi:four helix bundle protein